MSGRFSAPNGVRSNGHLSPGAVALTITRTNGTRISVRSSTVTGCELTVACDRVHTRYDPTGSVNRGCRVSVTLSGYCWKTTSATAAWRLSRTSTRTRKMSDHEL